MAYGNCVGPLHKIWDGVRPRVVISWMNIFSLLSEFFVIFFHFYCAILVTHRLYGSGWLVTEFVNIFTPIYLFIFLLSYSTNECWLKWDQDMKWHLCVCGWSEVSFTFAVTTSDHFTSCQSSEQIYCIHYIDICLIVAVLSYCGNSLLRVNHVHKHTMGHSVIGDRWCHFQSPQGDSRHV